MRNLLHPTQSDRNLKVFWTPNGDRIPVNVFANILIDGTPSDERIRHTMHTLVSCARHHRWTVHELRSTGPASIEDIVRHINTAPRGNPRKPSLIALQDISLLLDDWRPYAHTSPLNQHQLHETLLPLLEDPNTAVVASLTGGVIFDQDSAWLHDRLATRIHLPGTGTNALISTTDENPHPVTISRRHPHTNRTSHD